MKRDRAYRRHQAKRVQRNRFLKWSIYQGFEWCSEPRRYGMFRKTNFCCSCVMCHPWKFNLAKGNDRVTASVLRRIHSCNDSLKDL